MAALQCEICGGKLIGRAGGLFECDSCGMEFDTAWVKEKIQEIKGTVKVEGTVEVQGTVKVEGPIEVKGGVNIENLIKRGNLALEDGKWSDAANFFDEALNYDPECAEAYFGKACARWKAVNADVLLRGDDPKIKAVAADEDLKKALRFSDEAINAAMQEKIEASLLRFGDKQKSLTSIRERIAPAQKMIAAFNGTTFGVKSDGTVVATGKKANDKCDGTDWHSWRNIVAVTGRLSGAVGLCSDGTMLDTHVEWRDKFQNVVEIAGGGTVSLGGVLANGTVVTAGTCGDASGWRDIVAVAVGHSHTVGLRSDGTVVATEIIPSKDDYGQCNVSGWRDIVAIATSSRYTVGLHRDGTVVATEYVSDVKAPYSGQCNVSDWRDIVAIAVGGTHTVGLRSDGTVVAVGNNDNGECNVSSWRDIVAIAAGYGHTIGLCSNGTVVACGNNKDGECNVYGWKLFDSVDTIAQEREQARERAKAEAEAKRKAEIEAAEARRKAEQKTAKVRRKMALSTQRAEQTKNCAALEKERERLISERNSGVETETGLKNELSTLKGLFSGGRRKQIEAQLDEISKHRAEIDSNLAEIERKLAAIPQCMAELDRELAEIEAELAALS